MANMTFGVNLIPKNSNNTQQTLGNSENKWDIYADNLTATTINNKTPVSGVKGNSESSYRTGDINITAANIGLGNVENKSSETIRGELTKANVTTALGYTPPTTNTDTHRAIQVNGTQALGNNTTALNLKAGSNITITDGGSGAITIAATDTNTWRPVSDSVSSTSSSDAASSKAVKTAYDLAASKTANTGTVTSVATGVGLTGGTITGSGTLKAKLRSETALTIDSAAATTTSGRVYPVAVDKSGYLAVNVPWTDNNTTYSAGTGLSLSGTTFSNSGVTGVKGNAESTYRTGNVNLTPGNIGASCAINIPSDVNTWSGIYQALSVLPTYTTGTIYASTGPASKLTSGKLTNYFKGVVTRSSNDTFDFIVQRGGNENYIYSFKVTELTSSAGTPGTVYRFAGTAI